MEGFSLRVTRPRRDFKSLLGQANHLLITQLVGLAAVESGAATCPPELSTSWNPHDRRRSAERSREFALRSTLAAACDALDVYARLLNRNPRLLHDAVLRTDLDGLGRSYLARRLSRLAALSPDQPGSPSMAMVQLAVAWRNRAVHHLAEDDLDHAVRESLVGHADAIHETYQGLSVEVMLDRFDRASTRRTPSFKEVAAFVRASHTYVETVDTAVLGQLPGATYLRSWLADFTRDRDDRVVATWGKERSGREGRVATLVREAGFAPGSGGPCRLHHTEVQEIVDWTVKVARAELRAERSSQRSHGVA